jgi:hypothetical protein
MQKMWQPEAMNKSNTGWFIILILNKKIFLEYCFSYFIFHP